jgi:hypothetical protein
MFLPPKHSGEAGFDTHITKPVNFDELEQMLAIFSNESPAPSL